MENIKLGQLVRSKAGRDEGQYFLVFKVISESFILLVDGKTRKAGNPKKKNIKHLRFLPMVAEDAAKGLNEGTTPSDAEIRKAIQRIVISQD